MSKINKKGKLSFKDDNEDNVEEKILKNLFSRKIPDDEILENLGIFLTSKNLSRILALDYLYKKQINLNGNIFDFGTRWGQNATLFSSFRSIYEPFNRHKRIFAFDTFAGFNKLHSKDGKSKLMKKGNLSTEKNYEIFLKQNIDTLDKLNPLSHIERNFILKGDAPSQLEKVLKDNPEIVVSLAYFDFDLYQPTLKCLELLKNRFTKGSIIAFDEANDHDSPGETRAIMEFFNLNKIKLERFPFASRISFCTFE